MTPSIGAKPLAIGAPSLSIPPSLDGETQRRLSLNLGGGACKWQPPEYEVPNNIEFYKTLIAGFPSCDKRMTFTQMEALTGWPARDEWDFVFYGMKNHPFIKSNYPHHEGYWSWGTLADQVVMVLRNMRRTMVEYHDILWDIASAKNSKLSYTYVLYRFRPPLSSFFEWRDYRVLDEIRWYGWFIDYWMEGGELQLLYNYILALQSIYCLFSSFKLLLIIYLSLPFLPGLRRDIFTHQLTDEEHWPYYPEIELRGACKDDPWHKHDTAENTCSNSGVFTQPTPPPTRSPTPLPTRPPTQPPTLPPTNPPTLPPTNPPTLPPTNPPTLPPTTPPTNQPTPNVTFANYTAPPLPAYVAPVPIPPAPTPFPTPFPTAGVIQPVPQNPYIPVPQPELPPDIPAHTPQPYLFDTVQECCQFYFPTAQCFMNDVCPTPSPTPAIDPSYDPHCENGEIKNGCEPIAVISAEKLRDLTEGPAETRRIAEVLMNRPGISEYLIDDEAWNCIWQELIPNGKGNRMVADRPGRVESDYNFSAEMLQEMVTELNRLITKYSSSYWSSKDTANRLTELLMEHRAIIQLELNDVLSGARLLTERDFLGPKERQLRRQLQAREEGRDEDEAIISVEEKKKHFEYFMTLEEKVKTSRRAEKAHERQEERKLASQRNNQEKMKNQK